MALHQVHFKAREVAIGGRFNNFFDYWETKLYQFWNSTKVPNGIEPVQTARARTTINRVSTKWSRTPYPGWRMLWFTPGCPISVALLGIDRVIRKLHLWCNVPCRELEPPGTERSPRDLEEAFFLEVMIKKSFSIRGREERKRDFYLERKFVEMSK